jgi:regulator of CtrA degradation
MLARRLIDSLYTETMLLADEARSYFDFDGRDARDALTPTDRVIFSCESLKVTTRLMHVIAWLLTQRAFHAGEIAPDALRTPARRLGAAIASDPTSLARLPAEALALAHASLDLYRRIDRLDQGLGELEPTTSPARYLMSQLERAF